MTWGGRSPVGSGGDKVFTVSDEVQLCASVGSSQWHPKTQKGKTGAFNHSEGTVRIWGTAQVVMPGEGDQQGDYVNGFHPEQNWLMSCYPRAMIQLTAFLSQVSWFD